MSDVEYHADGLSISRAKVRAVFAALTEGDPVSPAEVVATLVRALAVSVCALGTPDDDTIAAVLSTLEAEIRDSAALSGALTRN